MRVFEDGPVLCGHRGCGRGVVDGMVENTLESFLAAAAAGLPWVEADARLAADGVLVARHDPLLADGRFLADVPAAESGLLRIEDLFAGLPEQIGVYLEVKTALEDARRPRAQTTAALSADLAQRAAARRPVLLASFDPSALLIARDRAPALPLGLITWPGFPLRKAIPAAVHLGACVLAAHHGSFPLPGTPAQRGERPLAEVVETAHHVGLQLAAWCPPEPERQALAAAGVDCLVIDGARPLSSLDSPA